MRMRIIREFFIYKDYCGSWLVIVGFFSQEVGRIGDLVKRKPTSCGQQSSVKQMGSLTVRRTWSRFQKITRFKFRWDEEDFQEGRPKQTVSQQDRPQQCNACRTEVYRNEKKKRYWRKTLLQKKQSFMLCVWMNMSQGLVRENAKYRGTSKSVGGGPWNASRESWWWLTGDSSRAM